MSTTQPTARFIPPTGIPHRQGSLRAILWPLLTGLLLVTASCGDLQDPASGAKGASSTQPSVTPVSGQQTGDTATPGDEASAVPAEPAPSLPSPETTRLPMEVPLEMPPGPPPQTLALEKPETQPVTFEWNPSPSGDAVGYKILISTMSATTQYTFQTGPETRLTVDLPKGESYYATLFAFNSAGQSPRTDYIRFDLF
ncbi:MAG: fibronectin type III domain-containing protein [Nitrospira sp.]|nr:fibronectin type III domain-containing protein [Nitrospira sp.]